MSEFVTLDRANPDFLRYLRGDVADGQRALPMRTTSIKPSKDKVTFQIVNNSDIQKPALITILYRVARIDLLPLTLMPALAVVAFLWAKIQHFDFVVLGIAAIFFLHCAIFCRNDYIDHMRGHDLLNEKGGSRVIQQGWLRASTVEKLFWLFSIITVSLVAPILALRPHLLIFVGLALLGVLSHSHLRWGKGHWLFGNFAAFLCLGPLLTLGMSYALLGDVSLPIFWLGLFFGILSLQYIQVRHMIGMVVDDESGLVTLPVRFGFDRAKTVLQINFLFAIACAGYFLHDFGFRWMGLVVLPVLFWILYLFVDVKKINSPLSSRLYALPHKMTRLHFLSGLTLILFILTNPHSS